MGLICEQTLSFSLRNQGVNRKLRLQLHRTQPLSSTAATSAHHAGAERRQRVRCAQKGPVKPL